MKAKLRYTIRLESSPEGPNQESIEIAAKMDAVEFHDCKVCNWSESYLWIARCGGRPVGYASLKYLPLDGYGFLQRAAVIPAHRRRGLHRRLIQCRVAKARALGWGGTLTYTHIDNCPSANSLADFGFRLYSPANRYAGKEFLYFFMPSKRAA